MQTNFGLLNLADLKTDVPLLIVGNSLKILKELPKRSFDLIFSDEPYDDLEEHREIGTTTRLTHSKSSSNDWYPTINYEDVIPIYSALLKNDKPLYMWRPSFNQNSLKNWCKLIDYRDGLLQLNGFVLRNILSIRKPYHGMGYSWNSRKEMIIYAIKDNNSPRKLNNLNEPDILDGDFLRPRDKNKIHPSQKPDNITRKVIENSTIPGEIILDPFAGSFRTGFVNSKFKLGRKVIGIEISQKTVDKTIAEFTKHDIELEIRKFY